MVLFNVPSWNKFLALVCDAFSVPSQAFETAKTKAEKVYVWGEIIQIVRIMYYSVSDTGILENSSSLKRSRTYDLYYRATGDSWELRPLK